MIQYFPVQHGSHGNSAVLLMDEYCLILDAGVTAAFIIREMLGKFGINIMTKKVIVLVTHPHSDHNAYVDGWKMLITARVIEAEDDIDGVVVLEELSSAMNKLKITQLRMKHNVVCWGFVIQYGARKIVWFTDTSKVPAVTDLVKGADAYLVEANYNPYIAGNIDYDNKNEYFRYMGGRERHMSTEVVIKWLREVVTPKTQNIHFIHLSTRQDNMVLCKGLGMGLVNYGSFKISATITKELPELEKAIFTFDYNPFSEYNK